MDTTTDDLRPLDPSELTWRCPDAACTAAPCASGFGFGQERAVAALRFGIAMAAPGYHVFVTGSGGSGRRSTVAELVRELASKSNLRVLRDHAYVHNFEDPSRPRLLSLPRGHARLLQRRMKELVSKVKIEIPALLEGDRLGAQREEATRSHREKLKALFEPFERRLATEGLVLVSDPSDPAPQIQALAGGRPVPFGGLRADPELFAAFATAHPIELDALEKRIEELQAELDSVLYASSREAGVLARQIELLERAAVEESLREMVAELAAALESDEVRQYLEQVASHVVSELASFRSDAPATDALLQIYLVNVLRDASPLAEPPVLVEPDPSFINLFGAIDPQTGERPLEFANIRAGALLRADGGYLILKASDFVDAAVWRALLRTLRTGSLEICTPEGAPFTSALRPDPIAIDVKVILVGDEVTYQLLATTERDFARVFKVKAEFEDDIENTPDHVRGFAGVARSIQAREDLLTLEDSAVACLVEHAARLAERQSRLSMNFAAIGDLIREAHQLATVRSLGSLDRSSIEAALALWRSRHDLLERRLDRELRDGRHRIETSGSVIGQVNALAVLDREPAPLGLVVRVTASVGLGRGRLINVERASRLSGPIHDKGFCVLRGYLLGKYGRRRGLAFAASIAFEQSYAPIDGDSASLAELCALLSALAEAPISQTVALTGSVDQRGNVQAIGGVNEKIEAWFRATVGAGRPGTFSCLIPEDNRDDLMLSDALVTAGPDRFRIFAVDHIDQAIPIVFGVSAPALHTAIERANRAT